MTIICNNDNKFAKKLAKLAAVIAVVAYCNLKLATTRSSVVVTNEYKWKLCYDLQEPKSIEKKQEFMPET